MNFEKPIVYAVKHKDEVIRAASRSGGIFTAVSDLILEEGGIVYGCVLDDSFTAHHLRAATADERDRMRGSKYVQSNTSDIFRSVKVDLLEGKKVLFSGTSCQIAGLKAFLGGEYDGLLCMDIVCHGVPSPLVLRDYLTWQESKNGAKVTHLDFRNKRFGWSTHIETLDLDNGKQIDSRVYTSLFYAHNILRPSCYKCPYKGVMHPADITIADYWGIDKAAPGFNDDKGVSLVLVNNELGRTYFERACHSVDFKQTKLEDSMQPPLKGPFPCPPERGRFWDDYHRLTFEKIAKKYSEYGFSYRFKKKMNKYTDKAKRLVLKILGRR